MMYTPQQLLVRKWKKTGLLDGILPEHEDEYAAILEMEAKKLLDVYGGTKRTAPNIWPTIRRDFEQRKNYE